jgi:hypothetical protein
MLVYRTPTIVAFKKRKLFHAIQKEHTESISDWFKRLQQSITECEYDLTTECILILIVFFIRYAQLFTYSLARTLILILISIQYSTHMCTYVRSHVHTHEWTAATAPTTTTQQQHSCFVYILNGHQLCVRTICNRMKRVCTGKQFCIDFICK